MPADKEGRDFRILRAKRVDCQPRFARRRFDITRRNVWPAPFNGRCLANTHTERWKGRESELMQRAEEIGADYLRAREAGNFDIAAVIAGESAGLIHDVRPAAEIVDNIIAQAEKALARSVAGVVAGARASRQVAG